MPRQSGRSANVLYGCEHVIDPAAETLTLRHYARPLMRDLSQSTELEICVSASDICQANLVLGFPAVAAQRITSVAWKRSAGGMVRPSACAVFRLMTSSNVLGRSTGKSAGLAPLRILSTKTAERWHRSLGDAP